MKTILISLIFCLSFNAQAITAHPEQLSPEQKVELLEVLNQMSPEMIEAVLTEEALEWYIGQFSRNSQTQEESQLKGENFNSNLGRVDIGNDAFNDDKAPTFNSSL